MIGGNSQKASHYYSLKYTFDVIIIITEVRDSEQAVSADFWLILPVEKSSLTDV